MLIAADIFFDLLHIALILFNLFGWIPRRTRLVHRCLVTLTSFFWLVIGPFIGSLGFCPITEWHWQVKAARGVKDLPNSYIDYLLQLVNIHADPKMIDIAVGITFVAVVAVTIFMWWKDRKEKKSGGV